MHRANGPHDVVRDDDAPICEDSPERCGEEHGDVRCALPRGHHGRHVWRTEHSYITWR